MRIKSIRQVRMIHRNRALTDWADRLVYGVCLWEAPDSLFEIHQLTGLDREGRLPRIVRGLRNQKLLPEKGYKPRRSPLIPKRKGKANEPAYIWVGVRNKKQCPKRFTPFLNVLYWQIVAQPEHRLKHRARLLDVPRRQVQRGMKTLDALGAFPPDPTRHLGWWEQDTDDLFE